MSVLAVPRSIAMSSEKYPRKKPNILLISLGKGVLACAIIQQTIPCIKRFFMPLALEEVRRIAELARIGISDAEARAVRAQLNDIFELIGQMQKVDTVGVAAARGRCHRARPARAIPGGGAAGRAGAVPRSQGDRIAGFRPES